jgi:phytoene synthase
MSGGLTEAYKECRRLTRHHGKTYYFSTLFFPKSVRLNVFALYGFIRYPDELVDNPEPGRDPADSLRDFRRQTEAALDGEPPALAVLRAFADTARKFNIPRELPLAYLDAMAMDLTCDRYNTFADLQKYMYGSAGVVSMMICHIIGATSEEALGPASDLGTALQLTNFWRDIGEDWSQRGRIYVPLEDLKRFDISVSGLASGITDDRWWSLMKFEIARARRYYAKADKGFPLIPKKCRLPVRLARVLYARILDKIEENHYDVFNKRAATTHWEKIKTLVTISLGLQ